MKFFDKIFSRKPPLEIRNDIISGLSFEDFQRLFSLDDPGSNVTAQNAMEAIPVQACCALIAGGIVSMPLRVVKREVVDGMMVQQPADDHEFWWLFNEQPNADSTAALFWENIVQRKLLWGRAFARIIRKSGGRSLAVDELLFLPNELVRVESEWDSVRRRNIITRYLVQDTTHSYGVLPEDMLDFRGSVPNIPYGATFPQVSTILQSARKAIGIVLTIEEYCARFFSNGGMPRTVLTFPAGVVIDEKQQTLIRDGWVRRYGGAANAAIPLVLANGGQATKLAFTAAEAQMLEARKFQVIEIARAFGVPPFMIGETEKTSAWGSGIEQLSQGFIRYTLGPHITNIEQEVNRKMFRTSKNFVDFDEEALARGDMAAIGDWFRQAVGGSAGPGFLTVNEVRTRLKLPPIVGGEELFSGDPNAQKQPVDGVAVDQPVEAAAVRSPPRRKR